jgi:hypothetical protein
MFLFSFVPIFCWFLLFLLIYATATVSGQFTKLRLAFLTATIIHGILVIFITEGLSYFSLVTFTGILLCWLLTSLSLLGILLYKRVPLIQTFKEVVSTATGILRFGWMTWIITAIVLVSLFLALLYPPNNYDSMTYHMARVAHWIQNKNISHYPTHVLRQLVYQPFAEWEILHFQVLTGGDRLANSVQLFYFIACISAVSLITKDLGGSVKQQLSSAFFAGTIPMAVIQSNTTQNDIVVAFFILGFAYYTIQITRKLTFTQLLLAGSALGLAFLTKGTSYIYVLLFCGWYLVALLKDYRLPLKTILRKAATYALIPAIALLLNMGFFSRNLFLNNSPLGEANKDTGNEGMALKPVAFVAIKNVMNHFPVTGNMKVALTKKAEDLGVDINDPGYSFMPVNWMYEGIYYHEDYMQNYIQVLLILLTSLFFFFKKDLYNNRLSYYALFVFTILTTSFLYCLLLKWQPWSNRLQIALFMCFSVLLGMEIGRLNKWLQLPFYFVVLIYCRGALFKSSNHPFPFNKTAYRYPFEASLIPNAVKECQTYLDQKPYTKLSLYIGADSWDYPYYKFLSHSNGISRTIKHFQVNNESSIYFENFVPDALITLETGRDKYTLYGKDYYRTRVFKDAIAVFEPK